MSAESIKGQFQTLGRLKRLEDRIARLRKDLELIPIEVARIEKTLAEKKGIADGIRQEFSTIEKKLRQAESDVKEKEEHLRKAESKLMEVKTNDEYQAALKENRAQKEVKTVLEETALKLMSEVEEKRKILEQSEQVYSQHETSFQKDRGVLSGQEKQLQEELEKESAILKQTVAELTPDFSKIYERTSLRHGGVAIVQADQGKCLGCNMLIRPQLFNEVLGYKALHHCPSCGKIIITSNSFE